MNESREAPWRPLATGMVSVLCGIGVWQLVVTVTKLPPLVLPGPATVLSAACRPDHDLLGHTAITFITAIAGTLIGMALGLLGAAACGAIPFFRGLVGPAALVLRSVPILALAPAIAQVVGYGRPSAIAITAVLSFFPTFVLAAAALTEVHRSVIDVCWTFGANRWQRLWYAELPFAVPALLLAGRIAAATTMLGALTAEYLTGSYGLGYDLTVSQSYLDTPYSWAILIAASTVSLLLYGGVAWLDRFLSPRFRY